MKPLDPTIQTRNNAYYQIIESLSSRRKSVFEIIQFYGKINSYNIAKKLHLPINCITPRVNELSTMRLIKVDEVSENSTTKKENVVWTTTALEEREFIIEIDKLHYKGLISKLLKDYMCVHTEYTRGLIDKEIKRIKNKLKLINPC